MKKLFAIFLLILPMIAHTQSTQIVDGMALSNGVPGINFIKNPNAQKNVANVTSDDSSTITRSVSTALQAGTEFNVVDSGAWSIVFAARTFDSGMNGRRCEAKVLVRGVTGVTTLAALDGTTVLGSVTATPNATTTTPMVVTFDCGAPTTPKIKLYSSTGITGTLEVGGAYLGLAVTVSSGTISTDWTSYTPTGGDQWTANATYSGKWRRVGDTMEIFASIVAGATTPTGGDTGGTRISLPTGYTIDTAKINSATANESVLGTWQGMIVGVGNMGGQVRKHTSNTQFELWTVSPDAGDYKTSHGVLTASQITNGGAQQGKVYAHVTVPIAGWSATDVVTPEATLVEYASNSSATDANDTTSFVNGPDGAVGIIGTTNISAARAKRVRFSTPIKATDSITVEVYDSVSAAWVPIEHNRNGGLSYVKQNTTEYGIFLVGINSTDIDIYFSQYAVPTGATYGSAGLTWDAAGAKQWRVKKTPGTGNQSVYISSPLVADPTTNTIKAKNTSGTDVLSIAGSTGGLTVGNTSGTTAGHLLRSSVTNDFALTVQNQTTGTAGAEGLDVIVGDTTSDDAFRVRAGSTVLGGVKGSGAWTQGPDSGLTSAHVMQNSSTAGNEITTFYKRAVARNQNGTKYISFFANDGYEGYIETNGSGVLTVSDVSDARLKTNIRKATYGLTEINALRPVLFDWIDGKHKNVKGFIAQDVQKVLPESVTMQKDGYLTLETATMIPVLVKGMQEQQAQIKCLVAADTKKEREECVK